MSIKKFTTTIQGITPLLMHAYPMTPLPAGFEKMPGEEQAEWAAYRIKDTKELYIPAIAIQRTLVGAAKYSKGKGRASLQGNVAACVLVSPEYCGLGTTQYNIDARPVVIPATGGRVLRYRPRLESGWVVSFDVEFDTELVSDKEVYKVIQDAGTRVGFLDFRPACKGSFGRFIITDWAEAQ